MKNLFSIFLLISFAVIVGCQIAHVNLTNQQKRLAADLQDVSDNYLAQNIERPAFGGKVFCVHKVLDIEDDGRVINEYVYATCMEYGVESGKLTEGTGTSLPVALQIERQGQTYQVVGYKVPGDSPRYPNDVRRIFPEKIHNEIFYGSHDKNFLPSVENQAKEYYGIK